MPVINPSLVPTVQPGNLFNKLTTDDSLNIRWLTARDPVFFAVTNRPMADITLRQLILAKAIDQLQIEIGHQNLYPFLINPRIANGSEIVDVPIGMFWDVNFSLPMKWARLRLAKIKRMSGSNTGSAGPTGIIRMIFTANVRNNTAEVAIFAVEYQIDSPLSYQIASWSVVTSTEEANAIEIGETQTVAGYVVFRTLDPVTDTDFANFLTAIAPPTTPIVGIGGEFTNPTIFEIIDSVPGDSSGDFDTSPVSHGTGLLLNSAWNPLPPLDSDVQSWIDAFNYPFDVNANRKSTGGITIPLGMFREFNITAPAGDEPSGDVTGAFYPVWISRIVRVDDAGNVLRIYFSTHNITDPGMGSGPSLTPVEFATLDIQRDGVPNNQIDIVSINDLLLVDDTNTPLYNQEFGRGHVILSTIWDGSSTDVQDFFNAMEAIIETPAEAEFTKSSTRIGSFGISRVPRFSPTSGQFHALQGSTSRLAAPIPPGDDNRFVTEQDQGPGDLIDLESLAGITPHPAIERYGNNGSLCHRIVKLIVDSTKTPTGDNTFFTTQILPRLTALLGRAPIFGDVWFNGTRFLHFNGDTFEG